MEKDLEKKRANTNRLLLAKSYKQLWKIKIFEISVFFLMALIFVNCEKETILYNPYAEVADELDPYFQRFEEEGAKRGVSISLELEGIKGELSELNGNYAGLCSQSSEKKILIDKDFWRRSGKWEKELIVFHELGHCYLNRGHNNLSTKGGVCLSIMRSGYRGCVDFYNEQSRNKLLDELFLK